MEEEGRSRKKGGKGRKRGKKGGEREEVVREEN